MGDKVALPSVTESLATNTQTNGNFSYKITISGRDPVPIETTDPNGVNTSNRRRTVVIYNEDNTKKAYIGGYNVSYLNGMPLYPLSFFPFSVTLEPGQKIYAIVEIPWEPVELRVFEIYHD